MKIKNLLAMVVMAVMMCIGCTDDQYLNSEKDIAKDVAISFNGETGKLTRALQGGLAAAERLNNNFVVYGYKNTNQPVFEYYNVNYVDGTANSTESNTAGWEYAGQDANVLNTKLTGETQDIKYWDMAADSYHFIAFSTGTATQVAADADPIPANSVAVSEVDMAPANPGDPTYTITGATEDLIKAFIADRVTVTKSGAKRDNVLFHYKDAIQFAFRPLAAKVRIALYETISGYSIKDVKFYKADDNYSSELTTTPNIFAGALAMPTPAGVGTVNVMFNSTTDTSNKDYNKASVTYTAEDANKSKDILLQAITTSTYATRENIEGGKDANPGQIFLGRASNTATSNGYQSVLPTGSGNTMTLKMDYTLISTDKSMEEIKVRGATAVIPSEFTNWLPNHAYTYIFKISDNTNGWTNPNDLTHEGLYPVTFDAIIAATEEGVQQTITLMSAPSITTYAKGVKIHEEDGTKLNYYEAGSYNLYICLQPSTLTLNDSNTKIYVATASDSSPIHEGTVADVIKEGTQDPAGTFTKDPVTVTTTGAPALTIVEEIPAVDAPYNTAVAGNFAVFQPTTAGTYVFEYTSPEERYEYDEYKALTGNEAVTEQQYNELKEANSPLLLKPNKHYKVIVVK